MFAKPLLVFLLSFLVGMVSALLLKSLGRKVKLLSPEGISLTGGLGMAVAFLLASFVGMRAAGVMSVEINGIFIASLIMLVFGLVDDRRPMSVGVKFFVQIIAALVLISFGVKTEIVNIGNALNILVTLIWILAITNAFNLLDVMDGVTAMTALIISLAFCLIAFLSGDVRIIVLTLALAGAILSFLIYNLPPARLYMGNSGSHFLGFTLAAVAVVLSYAPLERKTALFAPLLILGFPIFDTAFLILMRLGKRKIPFKKSRDHLVLRLLAQGRSKWRALMIVTAWSLFFAFCGVLVSRVSNLFGAITIIITVLASLVFAKKMSKVPVDG